MLATEDAYEELRLFFLELVNQLRRKDLCSDNDGYYVSYISRSVKNQYIAMSKRQKAHKEDLFSEISNEHMIYIEQLVATDNKVDISEYFPSEGRLSRREKLVLQLFFVDECSINEIAKYLKISRQAANQIKLRALGKVRRAYMGNL